MTWSDRCLPPLRGRRRGARGRAETGSPGVSQSRSSGQCPEQARGDAAPGRHPHYRDVGRDWTSGEQASGLLDRLRPERSVQQDHARQVTGRLDDRLEAGPRDVDTKPALAELARAGLAQFRIRRCQEYGRSGHVALVRATVASSPILCRRRRRSVWQIPHGRRHQQEWFPDADRRRCPLHDAGERLGIAARTPRRRYCRPFGTRAVAPNLTLGSG